MMICWAELMYSRGLSDSALWMVVVYTAETFCLQNKMVNVTTCDNNAKCKVLNLNASEIFPCQQTCWYKWKMRHFPACSFFHWVLRSWSHSWRLISWEQAWTESRNQPWQFWSRPTLHNRSTATHHFTKYAYWTIPPNHYKSENQVQWTSGPVYWQYPYSSRSKSNCQSLAWSQCIISNYSIQVHNLKFIYSKHRTTLLTVLEMKTTFFFC